MVMSVVSMLRTRFMRVSAMTICRPLSSGVAPPTMEVLPPCGTMGTPAATQALTQAESSSVLPGRSTASAAP